MRRSPVLEPQDPGLPRAGPVAPPARGGGADLRRALRPPALGQPALRHPAGYTFNYERGTADRWHIGGTWRNPPFGWKPGDFVLWDNLATWHYAVNDYDGPRVYRKVIAG